MTKGLSLASCHPSNLAYLTALGTRPHAASVHMSRLRKSFNLQNVGSCVKN